MSRLVLGRAHARAHHRNLLATLTLGVALAGAASDAHAETDIVVPTLVFDLATSETRPDGDDDDELDLANLVQSAARSVTTVQEAPAIVTIVTAEEIRARGYRSFEQLIDGVPGWQRVRGYHVFAQPLARGIGQASLLMHDGLSLFQAFSNVQALWRVQPLENIKRVEIVTGPGGVLWGANSFLGIINIIGKDAEDVDGVEASVSATDGNGDRRALRGYLMAGIPDLFGGRGKLFVHSSFETFQGPGLETPSLLYTSPPPQPNSDYIYGPLTRAAPPRSMVLALDGKLTVGALAVSFQAPFVEHHPPLGYAGFVTRETWPEDALREPDGSLACPFDPGPINPGDRCLDRGRTARDNNHEQLQPDYLLSYEPRLEFQPSPYEDFSARVSVAYDY